MEASHAPTHQVGADVRPWGELRATSLLWLINRVVFHPRGYALALHYPDGTTREQIDAGGVEPVGWELLGDGSEPWLYGPDVEEDQHFRKVQDLLEAR